MKSSLIYFPKLKKNPSIGRSQNNSKNLNQDKIRLIDQSKYTLETMKLGVLGIPKHKIFL